MKSPEPRPIHHAESGDNHVTLKDKTERQVYLDTGHRIAEIPQMDQAIEYRFGDRPVSFSKPKPKHMNLSLTFLHPQIHIDEEGFAIGPTLMERKGQIIADISLIQESLGKGCVSAEQFDAFIEMDLDELVNIAADQSAALERFKADPNGYGF